MRKVAMVGAAALLAACSAQPRLSVDDAWVRLSALPGGPAAAYFTLHGGATDETLISVSCDVAITTEMHESMTGAGGASAMKPLASVTVPAHQDVAFAPGGRHAMLFHVNPGIRPGRSVLLTLSFADGSRLQRKASVVGAGDDAPG